MRYTRVRWELSRKLLCSFLVIRMTLGLWAAVLSQPCGLPIYYIRTMVKTQQKIQVRELLGLEKNLVFFLQITLLTTI